MDYYIGLRNLEMMCEYLCPVAGTHPSEKLGEVTRRYGQRPSPPGSPEGGHLVGPPKEKIVHKERNVDVGVGKVRSSSRSCRHGRQW